MPLQRVLMFAYYFPPLGGGGVQRTLKFVKYLPGEGFAPIVVAGGARGFSLRDATLEQEVPGGAVVVRSPALPLQQAQWKLDGLLRRAGLPRGLVDGILWPDGLIGWLPAAVWNGLRAVRVHRPEVLYSTSSPTTAHLAALIVHRLTGLPWVADFRDAWTLNPQHTGSGSGSARARASAALERVVVAEASFLAVACESIQLVGLPPRHPRRVALSNGVDPEDLPPTSTTEPPGTRFRLSHVGSFYGSRDAAPVFEAMRNLIATGRVDPERFELRVIGHARPGAPELDALPVTFTGYVDHTEAITEMASASALLLYQPPGELGTSGKIYEYLVSGRPVLCVADRDNFARRLVTELGAGECASPRDLHEVRQTLERMIGRWQRGVALGLDPRVRDEILRRFSRRRLTADLAGVLRAAIAERRDDPKLRLLPTSEARGRRPVRSSSTWASSSY